MHESGQGRKNEAYDKVEGQIRVLRRCCCGGAVGNNKCSLEVARPCRPAVDIVDARRLVGCTGIARNVDSETVSPSQRLLSSIAGASVRTEAVATRVEKARHARRRASCSASSVAGRVRRRVGVAGVRARCR